MGAYQRSNHTWNDRARRWMLAFLLAPAIVALALTARALQVSAAADEIVIGTTVSLSGSYESASASQFAGLALWRDLVNAEGGVLVGGERHPVRLVYYDDASDPGNIPFLYERLIHHDDARFLMSSYSSAIGLAAAAVAAEHDKIIILPGSGADEIFANGYESVYQIYSPSSRYFLPALEVLAWRSPGAKIAFVYEDDPFAVNAIIRAREFARELGLEVVFDRAYPAATTEFGDLVRELEAIGPVAVIGGGHLYDGIALAKALAASDADVPFLALLSAPSFPEFAAIGGGALGAIYPSQWEPGVEYQPTFGPTPAEFVRVYEERYGTIPDYYAASGFAAGLALQHALEQAGTLDQDAVHRALDETDIVTFYGRLRFETSPEGHGMQVGHEMLLVQLQSGPDGPIVKEIVWPNDAKSSELIYPKP